MRAALLIVLAIGGCATAPAPPDEGAALGEVIRSTVEAIRASPADQKKLVERARDAYAARPGDAASLRFALLLAHLPPPMRDEEWALSLLAPVQARRPATPFVDFALLLGEQIGARQRAARESAEVLLRETDLRRAGEGREDALRRRLEALQSIENREAALLRRQAEALRAGEQREELLRRQIEGLRATERSLLEREERLGGGLK